MNFILVQNIAFLVLLACLSVPLGIYIHKVMTGQNVFLSKLLSPVESRIYQVIGIQSEHGMGPKEYALSVILFSMIGLLSVFSMQMLQNLLPLNPGHMEGVSWDLAFNTAASFVSNTNWQAYSGESTLSHFSQSIGLTVQNFVSAATGIAVLFALIRGFVARQQAVIGNFWVDLTRSTLYVLIPLSFLLALLLISQGVVQTLDAFHNAALLETGAPQSIPLGPAASQIAIKQLGTNGGGFFGANSAFPLENPTPFSNLLQLLSILLIPASLCISFGKAVKDHRQGIAIYTVMLLFLAAAMVGAALCEQYTAPDFAGVMASGNMEGKEVIHGVGTSALWSVVTTAASNGSVNSMHDSFTPLGGMIPMFLMQLGEIIFGGVGSGLYGMLAFAILTVFIAGLMVGRTPEYLGKKIEPFDMKMVCLIVLTPPLLTLFGSAAAVLMPEAHTWLTNSGAHGFSEILYGFSSMANNNGSAFAGFAANTVFTNVAGGLIMLAARFIPILAVLFLAGSLAEKKNVPAGEGTLSTRNITFVALLTGVILLTAALSFLPALALGPAADYFTTLK